jgi:pyridoxamine 5'-phosphate oxidase
VRGFSVSHESMLQPSPNPLPLEERGESGSADDPIALFQTSFAEAINSGIEEPSAMAVATVDPDGSPDARMMLLKGVDERGFVFYTNLGSAKAKALMHDPRVALCFYWAEIRKQVRVRGRANLVANDEADA